MTPIKTLLSSILIVGFAAVAVAQTGSPADGAATLPSGPLIKPVPDGVRWTTTQTGQTSAAQAGEDGQDQPGGGGQFDMKVVGEKKGDVIHIVTTFSNGEWTEVWRKGNLQTTMAKGWKEPVIGGGDAGGGGEPSIDWISADNFAGIQKVSGRDVMVFRDRVLPQSMAGFEAMYGKVSTNQALLRAQARSQEARRMAISGEEVNRELGEDGLPEVEVPQNAIEMEKLKVDAVATVDLESRLPTALQVGKQITSFKYSPLPSSYNLALPAEVVAVTKNSEAEAKAATRRVARP